MRQENEFCINSGSLIFCIRCVRHGNALYSFLPERFHASGNLVLDFGWHTIIIWLFKCVINVKLFNRKITAITVLGI